MTDPLDTNVDQIDTSWPRLTAANYDLRVSKAVKEPTKNNDGERLTITLETTSAQKSTNGETVAPGGIKITHYIGITEKPQRTETVDGKTKTIEAYTGEKIAKAVASVGKAARLNVTPRELINNPAQLEGKTLRCKVKIQKEDNNFPESNKIAEFIVIK